MANDRVAQAAVEVLLEPSDQKARVAQVAVEVLILPSDQKARVAQAATEALIENTDASVSATQVVAEVVAQDLSPSVSVTQVVIEVVRSNAISVNAGLASGSGSALDASSLISSPAILAAGTGEALGSTPSVDAQASTATGVGVAYDVSTPGAAEADVATGIGAAYSATTDLGAQAGMATGAGAAYGVDVPSGIANIHANVGATQQLAATVTGEAYPGASSELSAAGQAAATGSAYNATVNTSEGTQALADAATATGAAYGVSASTSLWVPASVATGSGSAYNALAYGAHAFAGVATASGTANGVVGNIGQTAITATAAGTAYDPTITSSNAQAGIATATGQALDPTITSSNVFPGVIAITGAAYDASVIAAPSVTATSALIDEPDTLISFGSMFTSTQLEVGNATIDITINGTSVFDDVVIRMAEFTSRVNGSPGTCKLRIRDLDASRSFTIGDEILLTINGQAVWRGWLLITKRAYAFAADNLALTGVRRFWDIEGADVNILFTKRFAFKQDNPKRALGPRYDPYTRDRPVIKDFINTWVDLADDDLNTNALVEQVAYINEDQGARPWQAGMSFGQVMSSIASMPGAVYYLRPAIGSPRAYLVYSDVDTANAPFELSDTPDGSSSRGYRQMSLVADATSMTNDLLAWGLGYGSSAPVFKREQATSSITTHGTWQQGVVRGGVYKQSTINKIADSIVHGSPTNHRGAKNDRMSVRLTTFDPGLMPGDKVTFTSDIYGFTDVFPIRQMRVSFVNPTTPRYELVLSHEIDAPNMPIDPIPYKPYKYIYDPTCPECCHSLDCIGDPPPPCDDSVCGITDTFTRTVANGWGTSDSGIQWRVTSGAASGLSVDGSQALQTTNSQITISQLPTPWDSISLSFLLTPTFSGPNSTYKYLILGINNGEISPTDVTFWFNDSTYPYSVGSNRGGSVTTQPFSWVSGTQYNIRVEHDLTSTRVRVWAIGDTEPSGWTLEDTSTPYGSGSGYAAIRFYLHSDLSMAYDNLDISGVTVCSGTQFDDFNRSVTGGWGTSSSGYSWVYDGGSGTPSVDGSYAKVYFPDTAFRNYHAVINDTAGEMPWTDGVGLTMTSKVKVSTIYSSPSMGYATPQFVWYPETSYPYSEVDWKLEIHNTGGNINGTAYDLDGYDADTFYLAKNDWTTGWYNVKIEVIWGTSSSIKVWLDGDAEPASWTGTIDLSQTATPSPGDGTFRIGSWCGYATNTIWYDYVSYDSYSFSDICFPDQAVVIDNWDDRTVALSGSTNTVMELTSGSKDPWYNEDSVSAQAEYGVENGTGRIRILNPTSGYNAGFLTLNEGGSDYYPYYLTGNGFPDELITGTETLYSLDVMVDAWGTDTFIEFWVTDNVATDVDGVMVGLLGGSSATDTVYFDSYYASQATSTAITFQDGVWYTMKVLIARGLAHCKVWARDLEAERPWYMSRGITPLPWTPGAVDFHAKTYTVGGAGYTNVYLDNFVRYAGSGGGSAVGKQHCETPTKISSTEFQTSQTYQLGTVSVYLNGTLQMIGPDVSLSTDLKSILFWSATSPSDEVRVCYLIQPS